MLRTLVLRTCFIGRLFCPLLSHTRLDQVSGFVSLVLGMVSPKCYCGRTFGGGIERRLCGLIIEDWCDRSCFALCFIGRLFMPTS